MKASHPKLNWNEFQKIRTRRKRRKLLVWLLVFAFITGGVGYLSISMQNENSKPDSEINTPMRDLPNKNAVQGISKQQQLNEHQFDTFTYDPENGSTTNQNLKKNTANQNESTPLNQSVSSKQHVNTPSQIALETTDITNANNAINDAFPIAANKDPFTLPSQNVLKIPSDIIQRSDQLESLKLIRSSSFDLKDVTKFDSSFKNSIKDNKNSLPEINLQFSWIPWHANEFRLPQLDEGNAIDYLSHNSFQAGIAMVWLNKKYFSISIAPQFQAHRFQNYYETSNATLRYSPNSVIGYVQAVKGFDPIFSDTISGWEHTSVRKNGSLQEWLIPMRVDVPILSKGPLQLTFNTAIGLQFISNRNGLWIDAQEQVYTINSKTPRWGIHVSSGAAMSFQQKHLRYTVFWQTAYRTAIVMQQRPIRHQAGIVIEIPLFQ